MVWLHGGGFATGSGLRRDLRRHQPRAPRRRRRRHHQPPAERVRLHVSRRRSAARLSRCPARGHARHRRRARVGARQHRQLRRRSEHRDDLRAVRRRPKGRDADGDAGRRRASFTARSSRAAPCCGCRRARTPRQEHRDAAGRARTSTPNQARELQNVPMRRLLAAQRRGAAKFRSRVPGRLRTRRRSTARRCRRTRSTRTRPRCRRIFRSSSATTAPRRRSTTGRHRDARARRGRAAQRVEARASAANRSRVIEAYRKAHPDASPWDLYMLIGTDHPRGTYTRETGEAKSRSRPARPPTCIGSTGRRRWRAHLKTPHAIEIPFVFDNIGRSKAVDGRRAGNARPGGQDERGVGGVREDGKSEHAAASAVAGVFGGLARHDGVQSTTAAS